ncbi:hypothetical protein C0Q70_08397 [Pomacea canaliculata]|uniref:Uncharacterized protein n=1 Tax=Pomacea canaliculata TaxID=400727 RepID=A0A2T7PHT2_POMCA|nr:hypothetical protein C0Q70_08397 [Pomacea canaliculata]
MNELKYEHGWTAVACVSYSQFTSFVGGWTKMRTHTNRKTNERPRYGQETAAERDVSFPTGAYGEEEDIVISDVAGRRRDENGGNHCHLEAPAIEETRPA